MKNATTNWKQNTYIHNVIMRREKCDMQAEDASYSDSWSLEAAAAETDTLDALWK